VAIPRDPLPHTLDEYREMFPKWLHKKFGEGNLLFRNC